MTNRNDDPLDVDIGLLKGLADIPTEEGPHAETITIQEAQAYALVALVRQLEILTNQVENPRLTMT